MQNTLPLNANQGENKKTCILLWWKSGLSFSYPKRSTLLSLDRSRASRITTSLGQLKASTERKATGHTSMPRNQYFGTKMPLAQQELEMLPSNARDEGKGSIADVNLCCRLSLEARRYGKTSIEAFASPVLIRPQNYGIERVSFFSPPLGISLGRKVVFIQSFRR
jgi:hypothetical protein